MICASHGIKYLSVTAMRISKAILSNMKSDFHKGIDGVKNAKYAIYTTTITTNSRHTSIIILLFDFFFDINITYFFFLRFNSQHKKAVMSDSEPPQTNNILTIPILINPAKTNITNAIANRTIAGLFNWIGFLGRIHSLSFRSINHQHQCNRRNEQPAEYQDIIGCISTCSTLIN